MKGNSFFLVLFFINVSFLVVGDKNSFNDDFLLLVFMLVNKIVVLI